MRLFASPTKRVGAATTRGTRHGREQLGRLFDGRALAWRDRFRAQRAAAHGGTQYNGSGDQDRILDDVLTLEGGREGKVG